MAKPATRSALFAGAVGIIVGCWPPAAGASGEPPAAQATAVKELMVRDLTGPGGKEVRMMTVDYVPGGASLPHRHNAQVFVYVLEGTIRMQVDGAAAVTLGRGDTFYEGPEDVHRISANASPTRPARLLVFMVKDKGAPVSSAVAPLVQR